jgi:hypothetical protein
MILRGPGAKDDERTYRREDVQTYDFLGKLGEEMLPGYRYFVVYKDLYTVYGGELDWFYGARGVVAYSNELWTSFDYRKPQTESRLPPWDKSLYRFVNFSCLKKGYSVEKRQASAIRPDRD